MVRGTTGTGGRSGSPVTRYAAGAAGVAAVTWLISLVLPHYHIANISMVYLLLVLALAIYAGSGPAILASVLSFLAFDWFFVPPVGRFTVGDPDEWLALFLLLVVAIITGQLAAGLRRRAEEARRRAHETSTLYELSIAILGDARLERVLHIIAERTLSTFALRNVTVFLLNPDGALLRAAEAGASPTPEERYEREIWAHWANQAGVPTGRFTAHGSGTLTKSIGGTGDAHLAVNKRLLGAYLPIALGGQVLGVVAATFDPHAEQLSEEAMRLFDAFVAQTALAIGRSKLAEEEERARAAAESERFKSTFLAAVSHDLRTPLTAIRAAAEGLGEDAASRADRVHRDLSAGIVREADRLNRLVGNLLDISRIEAGALPLHRAPEDVSEIVGGILDRLTPVLQGRTLAIRIPEDLPPVSVDIAQIDRVLTNLLENAAKFSPANSEIVLQAIAEQERIVLSIQNVHRPLNEEERARIFDHFFTREAGVGATRGTGLGLAICKGIVEAHGGRIWAEDDPRGVCIAFSLPLADQASTPTPSGIEVAT